MKLAIVLSLLFLGFIGCQEITEQSNRVPQVAPSAERTVSLRVPTGLDAVYSEVLISHNDSLLWQTETPITSKQVNCKTSRLPIDSVFDIGINLFDASGDTLLSEIGSTKLCHGNDLISITLIDSLLSSFYMVIVDTVYIIDTVYIDTNTVDTVYLDTTTEEIDSNTITTSMGPVFWLPLLEDYKDHSENNTITYTQNLGLLDSVGLFGYGSQIATDKAYSTNLYGSFTIAFWINTAMKDGLVLGKYPSGVGRPETGWNVQVEDGGGALGGSGVYSQGVRFDISDGQNGGWGVLSCGGVATDEKWHHVTILFDRDNGDASMFVDGLQ